MRRGLLVAVRSRGPVGLSVAGYSVRDVELFLDRFPGRVGVCVGCTTLKGSLTYVTARWTVQTAMVFLFGVEVATRLWLRHSQAKSFSADLEGNASNYSKFVGNRVELQTKSSLRLDSRYNAAFIHAQTVLRKRYINRYVSYAGVLRVTAFTSHQSAERGHRSAHESGIRIVIKTGFRVESHESVLYHNRPTCRGQQARK